MTASPKAPSPRESSRLDLPDVELKDPLISGILAWLVPGLGHLYQGRWAKAAIFFIAISSILVAGLAFGSAPNDPRVGYARVVYIDVNFWDRPAFIPQAGVGAVALPAFFQWYRMTGAHDFQEGQATFMAPMRPGEANDIHFILGPFWEMGTVFTMIAGLLNVLVIFDAVAGPVIIVEEKPAKKKRGSSQGTPDSPAASDGDPPAEPGSTGDSDTATAASEPAESSK